MKTYRINSMMTGVLFLLGSAFGVASAVVGGEVISSIVQTNLLTGEGLLDLIVNDSSRILWGSFLVLLMGISLVGMTAFLYPVFKKDNEQLAMGMLLFRGAMEGAYYIIATLGFLLLFAIGNEYVATGANSTTLQSMASVVYRFQDLLGPVGTILFLIGTTCIYISFYRTKLIPRWLTVWGLIGVVPYMAYAIIHLFGMDNGIGFYLQMVLAPQEMVMAIWLIVKGFNSAALKKLLTKSTVA